MAVMGIEEIGELCDVIATSLEIDTKKNRKFYLNLIHMTERKNL